LFAVYCSGGIAYSEWKKFKQRLKALPDVFEMEKKLNQYIYVDEFRGKSLYFFIIHWLAVSGSSGTKNMGCKCI